MWPIRSKQLEVYLGSHLVGWRWAGAEVEHWQDTCSLEEGLSLVRTELNSRPKARLRVWLASSLARPLALMSMAESGARNADELRALARAQVSTQQTSPDTADVAIWLGRPPRSPNWLAVAVDGPNWATIRAAFAVGSTRVDSIRPWWDQALPSILPKAEKTTGVADGTVTSFSIAEPDGMILGATRQGLLIDIGFELAAAYDPDWQLTLRRHALSVGAQGIATSLCLRKAAIPGSDRSESSMAAAVGSLERNTQ